MTTMTETAADPLVQRWVPPVSLALSVLGLAVSVYLTIEHYTSAVTLACPALSAPSA